MELNEKQFIKGFNNGYLLAKYEPQILQTLMHNISPVNSYIQGLELGKKEYELEMSQSQITELKNLRNRQSQERDRD